MALIGKARSDVGNYCYRPAVEVAVSRLKYILLARTNNDGDTHTHEMNNNVMYSCLTNKGPFFII